MFEKLIIRTLDGDSLCFCCWAVFWQACCHCSLHSFRSVEEIAYAVINVIDGIRVHLRDIATAVDDREIATACQWLEFGPGHPDIENRLTEAPMVTISVAKKRGSNAVAVAQAVHQMVAKIKSETLSDEIHVEVLRDYGETADDKVSNLVLSLAFAVLICTTTTIQMT